MRRITRNETSHGGTEKKWFGEVFGKTRVGSRPLLSNDRSASVLGNLTTMASNIISEREGLELVPSKDPFRRTSILHKAPPIRASAPVIKNVNVEVWKKVAHQKRGDHLQTW